MQGTPFLSKLIELPLDGLSPRRLFFMLAAVTALGLNNRFYLPLTQYRHVFCWSETTVLRSSAVCIVFQQRHYRPGNQLTPEMFAVLSINAIHFPIRIKLWVTATFLFRLLCGLLMFF
jgi:hypothetical protein